MLIALLSGILVPLEQDLGALGELAGQTSVAGLVQQELLITAGGRLAVQREGILALGSQSGIEAEQVPVTAVNGLLHFLLAVHHAALDAVHLAGGVAIPLAVGPVITITRPIYGLSDSI